MTFGWIMVAVLVLATFVARGAGMTLLQRPPRSARLRLAITLLPVTVLSAVVAVQTFTTGTRLVVDARAPAMAVATFAAWRRWPLPVVCLLAAVVAATVRFAGILP